MSTEEKKEENTKICRGLKGNPCIKTSEPQPQENYSDRSLVCRTCRNHLKTKQVQQERRRPKPRFISQYDLIVSRLWSDPILRDSLDKKTAN